MFDVPILVLVFNRPKETATVFSQLKKLKPRSLFLAADGPRKDKEGEFEKVQAVKKIFEEGVDWDCELKLLYRTENLGCRNAVSQAINWFFENVAYGIILEDDCVPDLTFFPFCEELLLRYLDDERVCQISGFNYLGEFPDQASYFASRMAFIWGWATWRRAWKKMDVDMEAFPMIKSSGKYKDLVSNPFAQKYMLDKWEQTYKKENDSWAYAWAFSVFVEKGLCLVPKYNLIQNAGFNEAASNTKRGNYYQMTKAREMIFPLEHPQKLTELSPGREKKLFYAAHKSKWRLLLWYFIPKFLLRGMRRLLGK